MVRGSVDVCCDVSSFVDDQNEGAHVLTQSRKMTKHENNVSSSAIFICSFPDCQASYNKAWKLEAHLCKHTGEVSNAQGQHVSEMKRKRPQRTLVSVCRCKARSESCFQLNKCLSIETCSVDLSTRLCSLMLKCILHFLSQRPFKCEDDDCSKSFCTKYHLARHTLTHTGERPYK